MQILIARHAHKSHFPYEDPELSPQGFAQSLALAQLVASAVLPAPTHLLVSPRKRTHQTFFPIAKQLNLPLQTFTELDQRRNEESLADFRLRIQKMLKQCENKKNQTVFICTHYDWIEESMSLIESDKNLLSFEFSNWSPTEFALFETDDSQWKFIKKGSAK